MAHRWAVHGKVFLDPNFTHGWPIGGPCMAMHGSPWDLSTGWFFKHKCLIFTSGSCFLGVFGSYMFFLLNLLNLSSINLSIFLPLTIGLLHVDSRLENEHFLLKSDFKAMKSGASVNCWEIQHPLEIFTAVS